MRPSSGPMEAAPSLPTSALHCNHGLSLQATGARPSTSQDVQSPLSSNTSTERPSFTSARLTQHNAAQPSHDPLNPFGSASQQQQQPTWSPLRKSLSMDKDPHTQEGANKILQKIQRSSSSSVISKLPNSLPGSLSDAEAAAFQQPAGALTDAGTLGRSSGASLSSSIFGEPNQWVIDYDDLVSDHSCAVSFLQRGYKFLLLSMCLSCIVHPSSSCQLLQAFQAYTCC